MTGRVGSSRAEEERVNLLLLASALWIGGAEMVIQHLAQRVDRRRFNVTVCHIESRGQIGEALAREGVDLVGIPQSPARRADYLSFLRLRKIIEERRIHVVHSHTTQGLVDAALCKLFVPGLKVVHTFHFGNYPRTRTRIKWMERFFSRWADRIFAVGEAQRGQLRRVYGFRDSMIQYVYNGVREPSAHPDPEFLNKIARDGRPIIGTIATMVEQKGLPELILVAERVREAGHKVQFVIVGDGPLRSELEDMRRARRLEDVVIFAGWVTNAADAALPAFDVFFQPSRWEAMSVVLLEAMAAGKAVVTTRVGENPRVVQDGVSGLVVDPGDVEGMASALERLIREPGLRAKLGTEARSTWERQFTVERMVSAYEQIYLDTVG